MPTSRSSLSSQDSEHHNHRSGGITQAMSKRWTTLETLGRCMFLFSVAFFIVGVLITVFGFSNTGIKPTHQIPLQVGFIYILYKIPIQVGINMVLDTTTGRVYLYIVLDTTTNLNDHVNVLIVIMIYSN